MQAVALQRVKHSAALFAVAYREALFYSRILNVILVIFLLSFDVLRKQKFKSSCYFHVRLSASNTAHMMGPVYIIQICMVDLQCILFSPSDFVLVWFLLNILKALEAF
jgi:hypothetical protein